MVLRAHRGRHLTALFEEDDIGWVAFGPFIIACLQKCIGSGRKILRVTTSSHPERLLDQKVLSTNLQILMPPKLLVPKHHLQLQMPGPRLRPPTPQLRLVLKHHLQLQMPRLRPPKPQLPKQGPRRKRSFWMVCTAAP